MPAALRAVFFAIFALLAPFAAVSPALAQDQVWLQIEAQPTLEKATERARAYSSVFPETQGFRMRSGWYAVALGPYSVGEGAARLTALKRENLIPGDSYIADGGDYTEQYWPVGGAVPAPDAQATAEPEPEAAAEPAPEAEVAMVEEPRKPRNRPAPPRPSCRKTTASFCRPRCNGLVSMTAASTAPSAAAPAPRWPPGKRRWRWSRPAS